MRRKLAAAAGGLALAIAVALGVPGGAQAATTSGATSAAPALITPNHYYYLKNLNSNLCANVVGESTSNGALIQQYTCGSSAGNDKWEFVFAGYYTDGSSGYDYYYLKNFHSNLCANVVGESTSNGALIQQYTCGSLYDNDLWRYGVDSLLNGIYYVELINLHSGLCANVVGASTQNRALVQQYTCNSAPGNDIWAVTDVP